MKREERERKNCRKEKKRNEGKLIATTCMTWNKHVSMFHPIYRHWHTARLWKDYFSSFFIPLFIRSSFLSFFPDTLKRVKSISNLPRFPRFHFYLFFFFFFLSVKNSFIPFPLGIISVRLRLKKKYCIPFKRHGSWGKRRAREWKGTEKQSRRKGILRLP